MNFSQPNADRYALDERTLEAALASVTHLAIGAHQDDLEILAYHGIATCYESESLRFGGVTVTDGAGSARSGKYSKFSDAEMREVRRQEQRRAAEIGRYAVQLQLDFPSATVKDASDPRPAADLAAILDATRPDILYVHNPADKHDTHIATLQRCLDATRQLPVAGRPRAVYGCEVWRDLDWLLDSDKVALDVSPHPELAAELLAVFESQIAGGKRYDLAALGRRRANATFFQSHATDRAAAVTFAIDLSPLFHDDTLSIEAFIAPFVERFRDDVARRAQRFAP